MRDAGVRSEKRILARVLGATGLSRALLRAQSLLYRRGYLRVVNYHGTPPEDAASFEEHLRFYAGNFSSVTFEDFDRFLLDGVWRPSAPGLVLAFDDGLRANYDVAAPLLERYGFTGWFFVPVGFIDTPPERQTEFARAHKIFPFGAAPLDGRVAMSWEEIRRLAARHVVGCHTRTHRRLGSAVPPAVLDDEIAVARKDLEARLGRPVETFCWVGGEEAGYSATADRVVRAAGYRYAFMNDSAPIVTGTDPFRIQRTNIEASWSLDTLRFQLSGLMDVISGPKRKRVRRLIAQNGQDS
jgi:peptidoglycan/xylan/chitin deacetylase (PgdA/CDA1 family)